MTNEEETKKKRKHKENERLLTYHQLLQLCGNHFLCLQVRLSQCISLHCPKHLLLCLRREPLRYHTLLQTLALQLLLLLQAEVVPCSIPRSGTRNLTTPNTEGFSIMSVSFSIHSLTNVSLTHQLQWVIL